MKSFFLTIFRFFIPAQDNNTHKVYVPDARKRYTLGSIIVDDFRRPTGIYVLLDYGFPTNAAATNGGVANIYDACEITDGVFYGGRIYYGGAFHTSTLKNWSETDIEYYESEADA